MVLKMTINKEDFLQNIFKFATNEMTVNIRNIDLSKELKVGWNTSKYKVKFKDKMLILSGDKLPILSLNFDKIRTINFHFRFDIVIYTITYDEDKIIEVKINGEEVKDYIKEEIKKRQAAATTYLK